MKSLDLEMRYCHAHKHWRDIYNTKKLAKLYLDLDKISLHTYTSIITQLDGLLEEVWYETGDKD